MFYIVLTGVLVTLLIPSFKRSIIAELSSRAQVNYPSEKIDNMSHLPTKMKLRFHRAGLWAADSSLLLYAQAKLRLIDSCQNGSCADY